MASLDARLRRLEVVHVPPFEGTIEELVVLPPQARERAVRGMSSQRLEVMIGAIRAELVARS